MRTVSPIRDQIVTILNREHALTAPALVERLRAVGLSCNKTSVYRALEVLLDQSLVYRHSLGDQHVVYELRHHHHDHRICLRCGRVENVECAIKLPTNLTTNFQVEYHTMSVFGYCQVCQKQVQAAQSVYQLDE